MVENELTVEALVGRGSPWLEVNILLGINLHVDSAGCEIHTLSLFELVLGPVVVLEVLEGNALHVLLLKGLFDEQIQRDHPDIVVSQVHQRVYYELQPLYTLMVITTEEDKELGEIALTEDRFLHLLE